MKKNIFKSLFFLLLGMILGIVLFVIFCIFIFSKFSTAPVLVRNNSWLVLDFSGDISEKPISENPLFLSGSKQKIELLKYTQGIDNASKDSRIVGIIINGDMTFYNQVHIEEISSSIKRFKESGKEVIAWFSSGNNSNYNLCVSANYIYMPDTKNANLTITGYSQTIPYYKSFFDKIGIKFNVIHIGDFKSTGESYVKETISDEMRNSYNSLLNDLYNHKIENISNNRKINIDKITKLIESGESIFMTPEIAIKYGFIDGTKSYEKLIEEITNNRENNVISILNYSSLTRKRIKGDKIAIIYAEGTISNYFTRNNGFNQNVIGAKSFIKDLTKIKKDRNIKALIIRVNSPGGSALASELILHEIKEVQKIKPVYISLGPVAASGGYYISCSADNIFASPSTITGSIGVVSILMNIAELNEKLGINFETLKKHQFDDFLSTLKKPSEKELIILKNAMQNIYNEFINHVITERNISENNIEKIAEGKVWTGSQAVKNKLVDNIGSIQDVIQYVVEENKILDYKIESFPSPPSFFDKISNFNLVKLDLIINKQLEYFKEIIEVYNENNINPCLYMPFYNIP